MRCSHFVLVCIERQRQELGLPLNVTLDGRGGNRDLNIILAKKKFDLKN